MPISTKRESERDREREQEREERLAAPITALEIALSHESRKRGPRDLCEPPPSAWTEPRSSACDDTTPATQAGSSAPWALLSSPASPPPAAPSPPAAASSSPLPFFRSFFAGRLCDSTSAHAARSSAPLDLAPAPTHDLVAATMRAASSGAKSDGRAAMLVLALR